MKIGRATGLQVAFLSYGVMLLAVPVTRALVEAANLSGVLLVLAEKGAHFFLAAAIIAVVPPLRRAVAGMLAAPIPPFMRVEAGAALLLQQVAAFGGIAALALWNIAQDGPAWVERMTHDGDRQMASAYTGPSLVILLLSSTIGPVIEEILFRGFLYRAFERQWGWIASLIATSALFGIYHPHFWSAFTGSVILICLLRRTGSLRAPILVHMSFNFLLWPPLLGQFVFPRTEALPEPTTWLLHGTCLAIAVVAVPAYVYMARDRNAPPTLLLDSNAALQK